MRQRQVRTGSDQRSVAAIRLGAGTRGAEMSTCRMWRDPAHQRTGALSCGHWLLAVHWSPRSRIELTVSYWEIGAHRRGDCQRVHASARVAFDGHEALAGDDAGHAMRSPTNAPSAARIVSGLGKPMLSLAE